MTKLSKKEPKLYFESICYFMIGWLYDFEDPRWLRLVFFPFAMVTMVLGLIPAIIVGVLESLLLYPEQFND